MLSRIESTRLGVVAGVQVIPKRAKASFLARDCNEQLLRMFVDGE